MVFLHPVGAIVRLLGAAWGACGASVGLFRGCFLLPQLDAEGRALAHLRAAHVDASVVIFLHDALRQAQSQSPASLLGREAGPEDVADVFLADALARVRDVEDGLRLRLLHVDRDGALPAAHGVDGVLAEVFYHPLEERCVEADDDVLLGQLLDHAYLARGPSVHVVDDVVDDVVEAGGHGLGERSDLGESVGDELQSLHVLAHLGHERVFGVALLEYLLPGHERGDGRAELVGRLLGESHPHLVLLGPLGGEQGEDGHDDEDHHHAQLDKRVPGQALEHQRVVVADVHVVALHLLAQRDAYAAPRGLQPLGHVGQVAQRVGVVLAAHAYVAEVGHDAVAVRHHHGDGVVVVEHAQHEAQVRVLVGLRERLHGLRPHLHACPLLLGEVARQEVGHDQRGHGYQYCRGHEENLHLPYPVRPLHIILINGLKAGFIASQEVKVWLAKWGRGEQ